MNGQRNFGEIGLVLGLGLMMGCGGDFSIGRTKAMESFQQSESIQVDVLFVIDNSSSMEAGHEKVKSAFDDFVINLEEIESEWHIGITTTDVSEDGAKGALLPTHTRPDGSVANYVTWETDNFKEALTETVRKAGLEGDIYEAGLEAASLALLPQIEGGLSDTVNAGFLREQAKLAIIWISDEDDCSDDGSLPHANPKECYESTWEASLVPPQLFVEDYLGLKPHESYVVLGAIVGTEYKSDKCIIIDEATGEPQVNSETGEIEYHAVAVGDRYIEAVDVTRGIVGNICEGDFADIFENMGISAASQRSEFELKQRPAADTLEVFVTPVGGETAEIIAGEGWNYIEETNAVTFYGSAIPPRGSTIEIRYEVIK